MKPHTLLSERLGEVDLPADLLGRILVRIEYQRNRALIFRNRLGMMTAPFALGGFFYGIVMAVRLWFSSGITSYLNLLFSDGGSLGLFWKEFLFVLAESLPWAEITLATLMGFICLFLFFNFLSHGKNSYRTTPQFA